MIKVDNLHFDTRLVDSYNLPFNFVISAREAGKSTAVWRKVYKKWKHTHKPSFVLRRQINDISETYINDISTVINKFLPDDKQIKFEFKKGTIKEGICNVYINGILFIRVLALSNPMSRVKSLIVRNPAYLIFDEFICNTRMGEKYLKDEYFKFKEIYNTYQRECDGYTLKCYFMGNPYSLYNPYFAGIGVDTFTLKQGIVLVNKEQGYIVQCYKLKEELKKHILEKNPLYKFDDSYTRYAFDGMAVNDSNIKIVHKQPDGYKLKYIFRVNHKYVGIYHKSMNRPNKIGMDMGKFWVGFISDENVGKSRNIYAVNFDNLVEGTRLWTTDMRCLMYRLKDAVGNRDITYESIELSYIIEDLYSLI